MLVGEQAGCSVLVVVLVLAPIERVGTGGVVVVVVVDVVVVEVQSARWVAVPQPYDSETSMIGVVSCLCLANPNKRWWWAKQRGVKPCPLAAARRLQPLAGR